MKTSVLGIDPGTHKMGVGQVEKTGNQFKLIHVEILKAPSKDPLYQRLDFIWKELKRVFDALQPKQVAIEDIFVGKNARSAFHLGLARGLVVAACLERQIPVFEYAPTKVKSAVTGSGRADKTQVKKMTELLLGEKIELDFDATDALAVAMCHLSHPQWLKKGTPNAGVSRGEVTL